MKLEDIETAGRAPKEDLRVVHSLAVDDTTDVPIGLRRKRRPHRFATLNEGVLSMIIRQQEINQDSFYELTRHVYAGDKISVDSDEIQF